jgi:hypothetical protein
VALIERIMGAPFEEDPLRRIAVHEFTAWCFESAMGPRTVAEIKAYFSMTPEDAAEFDAIIAKITGTQPQRLQGILQLEEVFILAENRAPLYGTPALVRSRLGL